MGVYHNLVLVLITVVILWLALRVLFWGQQLGRGEATFLILLGLLFIACRTNTLEKWLGETWQDYTIRPYNYVKSGADPLYFYSYDRFRKPYRWPYRFHSSYPYGHLEPYP
jgi:hypothetical protein